MKKLTTDEFVKKCIEVHGYRYDYSISIYNGTNIKMNIICERHGEFLQRASAHLLGQGCMECRQDNRRTGIDKFLERCLELHSNKYDYSLVNEYKNSSTKVRVICKKHGVFEVTPDHHLNRKQGCPECKKLGLDKFIEKSNIKHNSKYDYSLIKEYVNNKEKVDIICKEHGIFNQRISDHMISGTGCPECTQVRFRLSTKDFIRKSKEIHNNKYLYSDNIEFKSNKDKIEITCKEHGIFLQKINAHLSGQGCPNCNESKGEKFIKKYLLENDISFIQQYKFKDCKDKQLLPFDFYLTDLNICIEFNGRQHYEPISYFGGIDSFKSQIKRDNIKKKYCVDNIIYFFIIKYDENIKYRLDEILKIKETL